MKARSFLPLIWFIVFALAGISARAELFLTNYTAANPLKILPIGDSITDDSVTNGAWRAYLEPLLLSNGYAFTNIGRWASTAQPGFAQVHHEGMDGSVIAAPGVSGPTHGYALTNNYTLLSLSDALNTLSNTMPDLVIIDMGVNDIGRGRDPVHTATNDLAALLNLVFSKAPSAHIIISKSTTLSYVNSSFPYPYGNYYRNMYVYGDEVQALANARRAQGQHVYMADLFSAVYGGSAVLNSADGLHPNAIGRSLIANELMFRIASITSRPDSVTTPFILGGSVWKYNDKGTNLGASWSQPGYIDTNWSQGPGRLGYTLNGIKTTVNSGSPKYITTYFRQSFVVSNTAIYTNLNIRLNRLDGAVVYLNGQELFRANMPAGPITYTNLASSSVGPGADDSTTYFPTNVPISNLPVGTNVVAVEIHKAVANNVGLSFDLELFGQGTPIPSLSFTSAPGTLQLTWPTNFTNYSLQSSTNLAFPGAWQAVPGPYPQSNNAFGVSISNNGSSARFYRLKQGS